VQVALGAVEDQGRQASELGADLQAAPGVVDEIVLEPLADAAVAFGHGRHCKFVQCVFVGRGVVGLARGAEHAQGLAQQTQGAEGRPGVELVVGPLGPGGAPGGGGGRGLHAALGDLAQPGHDPFAGHGVVLPAALVEAVRLAGAVQGQGHGAGHLGPRQQGPAPARGRSGDVARRSAASPASPSTAYSATKRCWRVGRGLFPRPVVLFFRVVFSVMRRNSPNPADFPGDRVRQRFFGSRPCHGPWRALS
jgi:hypothetical protein